MDYLYILSFFSPLSIVFYHIYRIYAKYPKNPLFALFLQSNFATRKRQTTCALTSGAKNIIIKMKKIKNFSKKRNRMKDFVSYKVKGKNGGQYSAGS